MARMNWDKARRESLLARSSDYSDRMDAFETRLWGMDDQRSARRSKFTARRGSQLGGTAGGPASIPSPGTPSGRRKRAKNSARRTDGFGGRAGKGKRAGGEAGAVQAALAAEARRRGIKVKQLRRLIAAGKVTMPDLPRPSGRIIVSATRRDRPTPPTHPNDR